MNLRLPVILCVCCCVAIFAASPLYSAPPTPLQGHLKATSDAFAAVIERIKPGVVYISVQKQEPASGTAANEAELFFKTPEVENFFGTDSTTPSAPKTPSPPVYSRGSGFIISEAGHIMTNAHVIENAANITVTLQNRISCPAEVIGADPRSDIGLLKIEAPGASLTPLPLGSTSALRPGDWVLAFGSPYEHVQTVTAGIISAIGRNSVGISDYEDFIQTDAAINPGNSGGPLVNIDGEVIGISTAYITQTGGYMGLGFAIPIDMAQTIAAQLKKSGRMIRGWLGVALKDATPEYLQKQGLSADKGAARIVAVEPGSPAARTGLKKEDLIARIDDAPVGGAADLRNKIALAGPNKTVKIGYYRGGTFQVKQVMLRALQ